MTNGCRNLQNRYLVIKNNNLKFILWIANCFKFSFIEKTTNKKRILNAPYFSINKKDPIIIKCTQSHYLNASQCCRSGLKSYYKLIKFSTHLIWFLTLGYQNWGSSGIPSHSWQLTYPLKTYVPVILK